MRDIIVIMTNFFLLFLLFFFPYKTHTEIGSLAVLGNGKENPSKHRLLLKVISIEICSL